MRICLLLAITTRGQSARPQPGSFNRKAYENVSRKSLYRGKSRSSRSRASCPAHSAETGRSLARCGCIEFGLPARGLRWGFELRWFSCRWQRPGIIASRIVGAGQCTGLGTCGRICSDGFCACRGIRARQRASVRSSWRIYAGRICSGRSERASGAGAAERASIDAGGPD